MRSSEIKTFETHVKSLDALNAALKSSINDGNLHVGKWGHFKVTVKCTIGDKTYEADFSRGELAKFALKLANNDSKNHDALTKFKKRLNQLNGAADYHLKYSKSKRVYVGRKVASFVKHFHNPDKKIGKSLSRLEPFAPGDSSSKSRTESDSQTPIPPTRPMSDKQVDESWRKFERIAASKKQKKPRRGKTSSSLDAKGQPNVDLDAEMKRASKKSSSVSETEPERKERKGKHLFSVPTPGKLDISNSDKPTGASSKEEE